MTLLHPLLRTVLRDVPDLLTIVALLSLGRVDRPVVIAVSGQVPGLPAVVAGPSVDPLFSGGPLGLAVLDDVTGLVAVETFFDSFLVLSFLRAILALVPLGLAVVASVK